MPIWRVWSYLGLPFLGRKPQQARRRDSFPFRVEVLDVRVLPAIYTIPVSADGMIVDQDGNGVFESVDTTSSEITTHVSLGPTEIEERGVYEFDMSALPSDAVISSVVLRLNFTDVSTAPDPDYSQLNFLGGRGDGVISLDDLSNATTRVRNFTYSAMFEMEGTCQYDIALSPLFFQSQLGTNQLITLVSQMLTVDSRLTVTSQDDPQAGQNLRPQLIIKTITATTAVDTTISLALNSTSVSEAAGPFANLLTVTRSGGNLAQPLDVNLLSDDLSEASVQSTVTIPAGATSVKVPVAAIDDSLLDGSQIVRFAATANQAVNGLAILTPDPDFGGDNGIMIPGVERLEYLHSPPASHTDEPYHKLLIQPDGKTLSLVSRSGLGGVAGGPASMLTRLNLDGTFDETFGVHGVVNTSEPEAFFTVTSGMALQEDGKIVVVGTTGGRDWTLVRYNPDGSKDKTFGDFGVVHDVFMENVTTDFARDVVQMANGNLLVHGVRTYFGTENLIVGAIYLPDGTRFKPPRSDGFNVANPIIDGFETLHGMASSPTEFAAVGTGRDEDFQGGEIFVARYPNIPLTPTGAVQFYNSVRRTGAQEAPKAVGEAVAYAPDGKMVLVGRVRGSADLIVYRMQPSTSSVNFDDTFSQNAWDIIHLDVNTPDFHNATVVVQPDGRIVVGTGSNLNGEQTPVLIRYNVDGTRDETIGPDGMYFLTGSNQYSSLHGASFQSLALEPDGRLVGLVASSDGAAVVRFVSGQSAATSGLLTVTDRENLTLAVSRDTFSEGEGQFAAFGIVTRGNSDINLPLQVFIDSSDLTEASVPASVTIPANATFAFFPISAVEDAIFDGNQTVTLSVAAGGYVGASGTVAVIDNEPPGSIGIGDLLVSRIGVAPGTYEIAEFTPTGSFLHSIIIPWGGPGPRPGAEALRDIIQDQVGRLYLYNGTSTAYLTAVSPPSSVFSSQTFAGWNSSTTGGAGGIATFHQFVYATDSNTASGTAAGIVRFDRTDNSVQRFSNVAGYQDLTVGLNGLLYALNLNQHIDVYDPVTMALLSSVDLPAGDYRGLAVKANGQILAAGADGKIYLFDASGTLLTSVPSGAASLTDIDIEPGGRVIAGSSTGDVVITDANLTAPTTFNAGTSEVFVAFALNASFPAPTIHTTPGPATILENSPPTNVDAGILLTDDGNFLVGATVSFSTGFSPLNDTLSIADQNGITGHFDPVTGILRLDGAASVASYQAALRSVKYSTASNTPAASRTVTLTVTDGVFSGSAARVIQVTPENDPPRLTPNQFFAVTENSPNSTVVGTVTAFDDDSPTWNGYTIVSGNSTGIFAINPSTGVITVADGSQLDYEAARSHVLGITVSDGSLVSPVQTVTILVSDLNDTTPVIPSGQVFFVPENSPNNVVLGAVLAVDPDSVGDLQGYTIVSGNGAGIWGIQPDSGNLVVVNGAALDFEGQKTYTLGVRVSDGVHLSATQTIEIHLTDQNDVAPVVVAGSFTLPENSANLTAVGTIAATDVDTVGTLQNFAIVSGNTSGVFQIDAFTGLITVSNSSVLNFETTPNFSLGVIVSDGIRNSAVQTITIQLTDVNESPVLTPKTFSVPELSANGLIVGTITGTDPDAGQSLTYAITSGNAGAAFALNSNTGVLTVLNGALLDFETTSLYNFTVTATDNGNPTLFGSALITVNLTNVNDAPTINAGQSFTISENSTNGTGLGTVQAHDVDAGSALTYSITGGNASGAFAINPASGAISVADSSKLDFETIPTFTLTIKVTDNGAPGLSASAPVVIQVTNVNEAPVVVPATFTLPENSPKPTLVGTVVANDPDAGQSRLFSIISGNTNNAFSIHFTLGTITVNNPAALDFETSPTFSLLVKVQDNGNPSLFSTGTITVQLTDETDPPAVDDQTFSISEAALAGAIVGTVIADDPDPQQSLVYEITGGDPDGSFALNSQTGVLSIANPAGLDFETQPSIELQVQVTRPGSPPLSTVATITVNINDANELPVLSNATFSIDENSASATLVGTLSATDPDLGQTLSYSITGGNPNGVFDLNPSTGALRVAAGAVLNFETTPDYVLTVQVTDSGTPTLTAAAQVTIHLNNVNEAPDLSNQSVTIPENTPVGTVLATLTASNPELGQQLTYSILAGNSNNAFAINPTTGQLSVASNELLNFEVLTQIVLTVKVTDDGQPALSDTAMFTINLTDANDPPQFAGGAFTLDENSPVGTVLGTITAIDEDAGQQISYEITASDLDGLFAISPNGLLTIASSSLLDFETHPVLHLTITATDNGNPAASEAHEFTVTLTNVDEPPEIVLTPGVRVLPVPVKPQALDAQAFIRDVDSPGLSVANSTLEVKVIANAVSADKVRLLKSKSGDVVFKGSNIFYQGTLIGERTYGKKGGVPLTVRFNGSATQAGVEGVLRKISYQTKGAVGSTRTLEFGLTGLPGGKSSRSTKVVQLG